jgi:hypothetical protein
MIFLPKKSEISTIVFTFNLTYVCVCTKTGQVCQKKGYSNFFLQKTLTFSLFLKGWTIRSCEQPQPESGTTAFFPQFRQ